MDNNNNTQDYNYMDEYNIYDDAMDNEVYGNRYFYDDRMYDRYNRPFNRRYNRGYYPSRYYRYPFCDRYGRCENPIWWMFWPLFFM
ncbi:MAG: hypothetical protein GX339_05030 [Tissierellia bacterium]|nr:hypothetical protein [Tissierellia bacterium]